MEDEDTSRGVKNHTVVFATRELEEPPPSPCWPVISLEEYLLSGSRRSSPIRLPHVSRVRKSVVPCPFCGVSPHHSRPFIMHGGYTVVIGIQSMTQNRICYKSSHGGCRTQTHLVHDMCTTDRPYTISRSNTSSMTVSTGFRGLFIVLVGLQ